ncbi:MAG: GC-type dockerin domain-anchored protein, partial [Phycisphaerales bacterium JB041]
LAMQPAGVLEIDFSSLSQFDDLDGPGTFSAGGTLAAANISGGSFDPVFGNSFVVIDAAGGVSDRFDAVTGPALPGVLEWRVRYEPTRAVLIVSCDGDANLDGVINTLDVLGFLNLWTAGDPRADITGDGNVNTLDVLAFLNAWTAGC